MKAIPLLIALFCFSISLNAQSLKKYPIGNSGCFIYSSCDAKYELSYSEDSSKVYTGECISSEVTYGVICVKLLNPVSDLKMAEDLLISYTDFLKSNFEITKAAGYGRGHQLNNNEKTVGILDYWEDDTGDKWKIKAWTDGKFIGFIYSYSKKELPEAKVNAFLDGFRLPGM